MVNLRSHWAKERGRNLLRSESRGTTGEHEIQAFIVVCCLTTVMVCSEPIPILLVSGSKQRERKRPPRLLQEAMDVTVCSTDAHRFHRQKDDDDGRGPECDSNDDALGPALKNPGEKGKNVELRKGRVRRGG